MKNILEFLEQNAKEMPNKTLFSDINKSLSFYDVLLFSKKIGSHLAQNEMTKCPIAIFDNRNVETLCAMLGVVYSGNYYVVLDSHSPAERLNKIIETIKPNAIIYQNQNERLLGEIEVGNANLVKLEQTKESEINQNKLDEIRNRMISTDPLYALFTSGSTGMPKGTILSHRNVLTYIEWFTKQFEIDKNTSFASQTPFYFSMSVSDIFASIKTGATFNIVPKSYFSFPIQLINFLNERKVNTIYWVPSALCIVANLKLFDYQKPQYLQKVLFAGEVMPTKQLNYWIKHLPEVTFANLFGPTETTDICTFYVVNRTFADDENLPIGKHCDNCDTFIVDDEGKEITTPDKVGELYARGDFLAYGYFDNEEKTNSAFVQNPLNSHYPEKVYKTGDLVKLNRYGEYVYVGRKDFQIKHMGYRIELGEIETAARGIDKVDNVVCVYNEKQSHIVLIFTGGGVTESDLLSQIKQKVPYYMVPNEIIKLKTMPINQNGKIDRAFLKENYKNYIVGVK